MYRSDCPRKLTEKEERSLIHEIEKNLKILTTKVVIKE